MDPELLICYDYEMTATQLEQELSASGIDCVIQKETKQSINGVMLDVGSFCYAIYVDKKDYTQARDVLEQFNKARDEENPWCPKCGSEDITRTKVHHPHGPKWLWYIFDTALAAHFYFQEYDEVDFHCNSCGHDFKRY